MGRIYISVILSFTSKIKKYAFCYHGKMLRSHHNGVNYTNLGH